jgi:predicted rRNA methylase YqxC with S4 and FtsJ domains
MEFSKNHGWGVMGYMDSPLLGPKGNKEFLVHLGRGKAENFPFRLPTTSAGT